MLEEGTPIALSVNEMYSITKRLQLPFDASSTGRRFICAHSILNVVPCRRACNIDKLRVSGDKEAK